MADFTRRGLAALLAALSAARAATAQAADTPLPSWHDGPRRQAILDFLAATTAEGSPDFVPPGERLAVFDNDGTLWTELPMYNQFAFALDRVRALAPQHPEWQTQEPFRTVLAGDPEAIPRIGTRGFIEIIRITHAGMSPEAFHAIVEDWLRTARHPRLARPYTELIYQPMLELLGLFARTASAPAWLRGTEEFMRPGPAHLRHPGRRRVGTTLAALREWRPRPPTESRCERRPRQAGRPPPAPSGPPQAAFGNGDATTRCCTTPLPAPAAASASHPSRRCAREFAYDRQSPVGRLDRGWTTPPRAAGTSSPCHRTVADFPCA